MNLYKNRIIAGLFTLLFIMGYSAEISAQLLPSWQSRFSGGRFDNRRYKPLQTLQLHYNYVFDTDYTFTHRFSGMYENMPFIPKEEVTTVKNDGIMINAGLSAYYPLYYFNTMHSVSLVYGIDVLMSKTKFADVKLTDIHTTSGTFKHSDYLVPIGIAYKYGGESSLNKSDKVSTTIGAAIVPGVSMFEYKGLSTLEGMKFVAKPMFFAELGFFAGIEWKLRGTVYPVGHTFFERRSGDEKMDVFPTNSYISAKVGPIYTLGLAIMPFASKWDKRTW